MIAGVAIAITIAFLIAFLGMIALFAINFALTKISPEHYRRVVLQALESGTLGTVTHLPFAPSKDIYPFGGNDCLILGALVILATRRSRPAFRRGCPSRAKEIIVRRDILPLALCRGLAATMRAIARNPTDQFPPPSYYRRYIHGDTTVAALLLAAMSFATATRLCFGLLRNDRGDRAAGAVSVQDRRPDRAQTCRRLPDHCRHAGMLSTGCRFSTVRSRSLPPTCSYSRSSSMACSSLSAPFRCTASFWPRPSSAALIAILEFLTGGVPLGLATLIALIGLGRPPDWGTLRDRMAVGTTAFARRRHRLLRLQDVGGRGRFRNERAFGFVR